MSLDDLLKKQPPVSGAASALPPDPAGIGGESGDLLGALPLDGSGAPGMPGPSGEVPANGEALIGLVDMWMPMLCRVLAIRHRVPWSKELAAQCHLTREEKQSMRMSADAAAPFAKALLEKSETVALVSFGVCFLFVVMDRAAYIRDWKAEMDALAEKEIKDVQPIRRKAGRPPKAPSPSAGSRSGGTVAPAGPVSVKG